MPEVIRVSAPYVDVTISPSVQLMDIIAARLLSEHHGVSVLGKSPNLIFRVPEVGHYQVLLSLVRICSRAGYEVELDDDVL